jgi:hypothetical protein
MTTALPTIQVADELIPRIMAAFGGDPANYRLWLRGAVRDKVIEIEQQALITQQSDEQQTLRLQQRQEREAFAASVDADFGGTTP